MRGLPAALDPRISPFPHHLALIFLYFKLEWSVLTGSVWMAACSRGWSGPEGSWREARGRNGRRGSSPVVMVAGLVKRQTTVNERIWDGIVR